MTDTSTLKHLWRWPVKGLGGQSLESVSVEVGQLFPFDRAFALENGPSEFDPADPKHVAKLQFVCMVHQPSTGRLSAEYNEVSGQLTISTLDGRSMTIDPGEPGDLEALAEELVEHGVRGPLRLRKADDLSLGHGFTDVPDRWVSIQNQASITRLEQTAEASLDPRRLRANILIDGWDAFEEEELVGKRVQLGSAEFDIVVPINRCRAIDVNPDTAARDQELVRTLQGMRGKPSLGVYARVAKAGTMVPGNRVQVL